MRANSDSLYVIWSAFIIPFMIFGSLRFHRDAVPESSGFVEGTLTQSAIIDKGPLDRKRRL